MFFKNKEFQLNNNFVKIRSSFLLGFFFCATVFVFSASDARAFANTGTYTSQIKDMTLAVNFNAITWTASTPINGSLLTYVTMKVRAGNVATPDNTWTGWTSVAQGGSLTLLSGNQWIQYEATLSTDDINIVPILQDVNISYSYYTTTAQKIISSPYNTQSSSNGISSISWNEIAPTNTDVKFQMRTAQDVGGAPNWTNGSGWCGPTTCGSPANDISYASTFYNTTKAGEVANAIHGAGNDDQWIQYVVWLKTDDGSITPSLQDATITYVVNAPPIVAITAQPSQKNISQQNTGKIELSYSIQNGGIAPNNEPTDTFQTALFYTSQNGTGLKLAAGINNSVTTLGITGSDGQYLPTAGYIQVDNEIIKYTAKSGSADSWTLSGLTRGSWATTDLGWISTPVSHTINAPIYVNIPSNNISTIQSASEVGIGNLLGDNGSALPGDTNPAKTYALRWDPQTDTTFGDRYDDQLILKVTSNDKNAANQIGTTNSSAFVVDTKNPASFNFYIDHENNNLHITNSALMDDSNFDVYISNNFDTLYASEKKSLINQGSTFPYDYTIAGLSADPALVYMGVIDNYNNSSYISQVTPLKPQNIVYFDTSNNSIDDYREFISWEVVPMSSGVFSYYDIYRSTDGAAFVSIGHIPGIDINYFTDVTVSTGINYAYKVMTVDLNGSSSLFSSIVSDTPDGQGGTDNTPPVISNVQIINISTTSARITWDTDELSDSAVEYGLTTSYGTTKTSPSMVKNHTIVLSNLIPNTQYNFKVISEDNAGIPASSGNLTFSTLDGPAISNVVVVQASNKQAVIQWDTDVNSSSETEFSTNISNGELANSAFKSQSDSIKHHELIVTGLDAGTRYYFKVKSTAGNVTGIDDNGGDFYVMNTTNDTALPQILMLNNGTLIEDNSPLILTDKKIAVSFSTSKQTQQKISYKKLSDPEYTIFEDWGANYNKDHAFVIDNLDANTEYQYKIEAKDINILETIPVEKVFTTLDIQLTQTTLTSIGDPVELSVSDTQALVKVSTDSDATARLCYSLDQNQLNICIDSVSSKDHIFQLGSGTNDNPRLIENKTYYYKIIATDTNKNAISKSTLIKNFLTKKKQIDQYDPFTKITIGEKTIGANFVFLEWTTDEPARGDVVCIDDNENMIMSSTSDISINHVTKIPGLLADTKYSCEITAVNEFTPPTTVLETFVFITGKSVEFAHDPLSKIENVLVPEANVSDTSAVVTFTTDQIASCKIDLTSLKDGKSTVITRSESGYDEAKNYNVSHALTLSNLDIFTDYSFIVSCHDNLIKDEAKTAIDERFNFITKTGAFKTLEKLYTAEGAGALGDSVAPVINNVNVSAINGESVTVSWDSNEKANSIVRYGLDNTYGNIGGDDLVNSDKNNFNTSHSVIVNGLIPATKYIFVASSTDASGNIGQSSESSFTTASPSSLSSIKAVSKNLGQALITWNTSSETTSTVEYGLTTSYGEKKESTTQTKEHSIDLSNLNQGVVYHFRVKGKDKDGKLYASSDQTFEPKSPPQITNININDITEHDAKVSFETNVPTQATVNYTNISDNADNGSQANNEMATKHTIQLKNLTQGATFKISVNARDEQGTESIEQANDLTTGKDENPPKIDMVKTDLALAQNDKVQAIISWTTDEQASTSLLYKESRNAEPKEINISNALTTSHVAVLTIFKPGTVYYFNTKSTDSSGNTSISSDYALLTPRRKENIIQIIIANFTEIFGWAQMKK